MKNKILKRLEEGYRNAYRAYLLAKEPSEITEARSYYIGYSRAFEHAMQAVGYIPMETEERCIEINNEIEAEQKEQKSGTEKV